MSNYKVSDAQNQTHDIEGDSHYVTEGVLVIRNGGDEVAVFKHWGSFVKSESINYEGKDLQIITIPDNALEAAEIAYVQATIGKLGGAVAGKGEPQSWTTPVAALPTGREDE